MYFLNISQKYFMTDLLWRALSRGSPGPPAAAAQRSASLAAIGLLFTQHGVIAVRIEVSDVKVVFQWLCTFPPVCADAVEPPIHSIPGGLLTAWNYVFGYVVRDSCRRNKQRLFDTFTEYTRR